MQDPTEPDRPEILNGPGEGRRAARNRPSKKKKITVIAASVLVAAMAVGGVGYALTAGSGETGTPTQQSRQAGPEQGAGETGSEGEPLQDEAAADEATMGDADTGLPEEEAAEMGDASVGDTSGDTRDTRAGSSDKSTASKGDGAKQETAAKQDNSGKKPTTAAKPPPSDEGDNPADGPAGTVGGQCAKSGC